VTDMICCYTAAVILSQTVMIGYNVIIAEETVAASEKLKQAASM